MSQVPPDMLDTIITGDCLEVMKRLPDGCVDAVVTDPPYGIGHKSHGQRFRQAVPIANDENTRLFEWIAAWADGNCPLVAFYSPYAPPPISWRSILVWAKGAHVGIGGDRDTCWKRDAEFIGVKGNGALNGKRDSCVIYIPALLPPPTGHFCEKPVELMEYLISKTTKVGDIILDPFAGSGTTCVAAKRLGRHYIGIEIDEGYAQTARNRLRDTEKPLFQDNPG